MTNEVQEMHGLKSVLKKTVAGWDERQDVVLADANGLIQLSLSSCGFPAGLTPEQARYLARKLYRLARRVEEPS